MPALPRRTVCLPPARSPIRPLPRVCSPSPAVCARGLTTAA
ncbi:hypothetical protein [Lysobacter gummosus]